MNKIGVINYGLSNLTSISNALEFHQIPYEIVNHYDGYFDNDYLGFILPGVGSFGSAMQIIKQSSLQEYLNLNINILNKPILGICLGMQLLFDKSEESEGEEGLGFIPGKIVRFSEDSLKIPHVGWNNVIHDNQGLFDGVKNKNDFYFDHSYYSANHSCSIAKSTYGIEFTSCIQYKNIFGVQFHPERSQIEGLKIFLNFAKICGVNFA